MDPLDRIILAHGGGGVLMRELVAEVIVGPLCNDVLAQLADSAVLDRPAGRLAFTTDTYVVQPIFFRGGDIGRLAVAGTVNDLAVVGATPLALSLGLILEEGLPIADLRRIVASMSAAAEEANVRVVTGDTKVVGRGAVDRIFINTSGVGVVPDGVDLGPHRIRPGDAVLVNGPIAQHGVAILSEREGLAFQTPVESDLAPLNGLIAACLSACDAQAGLSTGEVHFMRDATRGGLAAVLNEMSGECGLAVEIDERAVPVAPAVASACDLLGLDPLTVANEGKIVLVCAAGAADAVLAAMRSHERGRGAAVIGRVTRDRVGGETRPSEHRLKATGLPAESAQAGGTPQAERRVILRTRYGGTRILEMPYGEDLPRIC